MGERRPTPRDDVTDPSFFLSNFMFGNIDGEGRLLDSDIFSPGGNAADVSFVPQLLKKEEEQEKQDEESTETPLSKVLPLTYEGKSVYQLYPDFRKDEVLNFSKLFANIGTGYQPSKWSALDKVKKVCSSDNTKYHVCDEDYIKRLRSLTNLLVDGKVPCARDVEPEVDISNVSARFGARKPKASGAPQVQREKSVWCTNDTLELVEELKRVRQLYLDEVEESFKMFGAASRNKRDPLPIEILPWEKKIIYDWANVPPEPANNMKSIPHGGWIPSRETRTIAEYRRKVLKLPADYLEKPYGPELKKEWISIFPTEADEFERGDWEKDIIFDANTCNLDTNVAREDLIPPLGGGKEKLVLLTTCHKGPRHVGKDKTYTLKSACDQQPSKSALADSQMASANWLRHHLRHVGEAYRLSHRLFPTHLPLAALRSFHRPRIRSGPGACPRIIVASENQTKFEKISLFEYMEQHPTVLNQPGMGVCVRNFAKKVDAIGTAVDTGEYGAPTVFVSRGPLLGNIPTGQQLKTVECNLFKAPIVEHPLSHLYFLLMINKGKMSVHRVSATFLVGQQLPQVEIPSPNSKRASILKRDFLQAFILRQFRKTVSSGAQADTPPSIRMEEIRRFFPLLPEASIRKKLKQYAAFRRGVSKPDQASHLGTWTLRDDYRLPSEEEIRKIITPEQCCAWYSLLSAERRYRDQGIIDKLGATIKSESDDTNSRIASELECAPWHTSKAYLDSMRGRCLLKLEGAADPTGRGLGFSFVPMALTPCRKLEQVQDSNKGCPNSTDGTCRRPAEKGSSKANKDAQRLHLKEARRMLAQAGVPEATIRTLSRWEVIYVVRAMSDRVPSRGDSPKDAECKAKEKAISLTPAAAAALKRFVGNRRSQYDQTARYKAKCQKILEAQLKFLREGCKDDDRAAENHARVAKSRLRITRFYVDEETGLEFSKSEEVMGPDDLIASYVKIRESKTDEEIRQMLRNEDSIDANGDPQEQAMPGQEPNVSAAKRKRKRADAAESEDFVEEACPTKLKCGACGGLGHMRTNRECPAYVQKEQNDNGSNQSEPCTGDENQYSLRRIATTKLVISRQALKTSTPPATPLTELKSHEKPETQAALTVRIPKSIVVTSKPNSTGATPTEVNKPKRPKFADYLNDRPLKRSHRRRIDPLVSLSVVFETIINSIREMDEAQMFLAPVSVKDVPDYYRVVQSPVDLQTIRQRAVEKRYANREMFMRDMKLLVDNSVLYNGIDSPITADANVLFSSCVSLLARDEERLMLLEKQINPLLDEDDCVVLCYVLDRIVSEHVMKIENAWQFVKPVSRSKYPEYYQIVETPIDLETIKGRIESRSYKSEQQFMSDISLLYSNSKLFNGEASEFTITARQIVDTCEKCLSQEPYRSTIDQLKLNSLEESGQVEEDLFGEISDDSES